MKRDPYSIDEPDRSWFLPVLLPVIILLSLFHTVKGQINYSFYAVYDRILDSETQDFTVWGFALSGDGNTIAVGGNDNVYDYPVIYTLNSDGSNLQSINLPGEVSGTESLSLDSAGSVLYFYSLPVIYKVINGEVIPIFNIKEETNYDDIYRLVTNGKGNYVFFAPPAAYDQGWIYRINSDGTGLEQMVNYKDVIRDGGYTGGLDKSFSVSHDGSKIAFTMGGYHDDRGFHYKGELFLRDEEGYHQLTNESEVTSKGHPMISGDGSKIVFYSSNSDNKWYSINTDGSGRVPIADHGSNFTGLDVTYDGSMMVHGEGSAKGGCLVATDGSWERELFSSTYPWNLQFNHLWSQIKMSDDGKKICFLFSATEDKIRTYSLYVGYFNNPFAVPDAPLIENISMVPEVIPDVPDARLLLSTRISDPQGLEDLKYRALNELGDGRKLFSGDYPVHFRWDPNDSGEWPDEQAGDGVFWSEGETENIVDQFTEAGIRMGVVDRSWTVVIADTVFDIATIPAPAKVVLACPADQETGMDTALFVSWHGAAHAVRYHVQIGLDGALNDVIIENEEVRDTSLSVNELEKNTAYYWRVRAHNAVEFGEWSEIFSFSTLGWGTGGFENHGEDHVMAPVIRPNPVIVNEPATFCIAGGMIRDIAISELLTCRNLN